MSALRIIVLFVSQGFWLHSGFAQTPNSPQVIKSAMTFDVLTYDYGTLPFSAEEENGDCTFKFTNYSEQPLIISAAIPSCGCITPKAPLNTPFAPGEGGEINIHYRTSRVGKFVKNINLETNQGVFMIYIKGTIVPE